MTWTKTKKIVVGGSIVVVLALVATTLYLKRQDISDWMTIHAGERAVAKHIATPVDMNFKCSATCRSRLTASCVFGARAMRDRAPSIPNRPPESV